MSSQTYRIIGEIASAVVLGACALWIVIRSFKKSDDPELLLFKWVLTALVVGFIAWQIGPMVKANSSSEGVGGVILTAFSGLVLASIWRRNIANFIAKPFSSLYDGGDAEIE